MFRASPYSLACLATYTQKNGAAERMNHIILERVRCMLSNAGLWDKHGLWTEAASAACYLINRSPK